MPPWSVVLICCGDRNVSPRAFVRQSGNQIVLSNSSFIALLKRECVWSECGHSTRPQLNDPIVCLSSPLKMDWLPSMDFPWVPTRPPLPPLPPPPCMSGRKAANSSSYLYHSSVKVFKAALLSKSSPIPKSFSHLATFSVGRGVPR